MKLGDVIRGGLVGILKDGSIRPLPISVIRKPLDQKYIKKNAFKNSIIIASHYKWLESPQFIPKNCIKVFHSFSKSIDWCSHPQALLSESDMVDKSWCGGPKPKIKQDGVLMVTLDHESGMHTKGFFLVAVVAEACRKINQPLTIIDYGRGGGVSSELERVRKFIESKNYHIVRRNQDNNQKKLAEIFRRHKMFICTSIKDASPKTVPEALCRGLRVMMNSACWGGSKYIEDSTGCLVKMPKSPEEMWDTFSATVERISEAITYEINKCKDPVSVSNFYHSKWGLYNSSTFLAKELGNNFPECIAICYEELRKQVMKEVLCKRGS